MVPLFSVASHARGIPGQHPPIMAIRRADRQAALRYSMNITAAAMTARGRQEDKHRGFLVGRDDYMTKPVDKSEFFVPRQDAAAPGENVDEQKVVIGRSRCTTTA